MTSEPSNLDLLGATHTAQRCWMQIRYGRTSVIFHHLEVFWNCTDCCRDAHMQYCERQLHANDAAAAKTTTTNINPIFIANICVFDALHFAKQECCSIDIDRHNNSSFTRTMIRQCARNAANLTEFLDASLTRASTEKLVSQSLTLRDTSDIYPFRIALKQQHIHMHIMTYKFPWWW